MREQPVLRIGLVSDVQYGDKDDSFIEERWQHLREAKGKVQEAVEEWNKENVAVVVHLGDIIDGQDSRAKSLSDLEEITAVLGGLKCPVYHVIGNHCVGRPPELIDRKELLEKLGGGHLDRSYYKFSPCPGWTFIMLDTTDMALPEMVGWDPESENAKEAREFWDSHTVDDLDQLRVWNGGLTRRQIEWLKTELEIARKSGDRVIVAGHHPLGKGCARTLHYAWNAEEVERLLLDCPNVVLALNGHDHIGGYACNEGLHFVGFEGLVESPTGSNAYAIMEIYSDRILIHGRGSATSRDLRMRPLV